MKNILLLIITLFSCTPKNECVPQNTRCLGNQSQICNLDKSWQLITDCNKTNIKTVCQYIDEQNEDGHVTGYTCVKNDGGK